METSFANAGQLSYGYTTPWAAPGIPTKALKWLFKSHPPLLFRPDGSLYQIEWLWQMLQNCTAARYQINKERMVRISEYSREMFRRFEAQTGMNFEGRKKGTLQIFRQTKEVEAAEQDIAVLERYGVPYRCLKPEERRGHRRRLHRPLRLPPRRDPRFVRRRPPHPLLRMERRLGRGCPRPSASP